MTKDQLVQQIQYELEQLQKSAEIASQLAAVSPSERKPWDSAAAAKFVSDLVAGLENLCRRRLKHMSLPLPQGPQSHTLILDEFLACEELGGQLSEDLQLRLRKYLRFRHRFIHGYGYEVNWEIVEEPLQLLSETVDALAQVWATWIDTLPDDS